VKELLTETSKRSVAETIERLLADLERRSITVFAAIDHAAAARGVGLDLPPETVIVFGNPQAGTPLMQADPTVGIDLPLRILIWDDNGTTMLGCQDPMRLGDDYNLGDAAMRLRQMRALLTELMSTAAGSTTRG
jgi:uncharacterized protein (DUF302 family)